MYTAFSTGPVRLVVRTNDMQWLKLPEGVAHVLADLHSRPARVCLQIDLQQHVKRRNDRHASNLPNMRDVECLLIDIGNSHNPLQLDLQQGTV